MVRIPRCVLSWLCEILLRSSSFLRSFVVNSVPSVTSKIRSSSLPHQQPQKERPANQRRNHSNRQLNRRHHRSREHIATDQERRTEECRCGEHEAMIRADDQPDEVRYDDADESDRAAD